MILENKLCIFEIKTGTKERKARKQLKSHRTCMQYLQNDMSSKGMFYSEVKTFWVSEKENKVVNTITNREISLIEFLQNPIPFLLA